MILSLDFDPTRLPIPQPPSSGSSSSPRWPSSKGRQVYSAFLRIGWRLKHQSGSHHTLERSGWPNYVFAYADGDELGPRILAKIGKRTGLTPGDL